MQPPLEATSPAPMTPAIWRVLTRRRETHDTWTLRVQAPNAEAARFAPGQFNMLYAMGVGEVPISISASADDGQLHTIRAVGAVTRALCGLRTGSLLGVRGPFGTPWPVADAKGQDLLFMAGGLGLAPLRPAIRAAFAQRESYGRIVILYGARNPTEILYRRDLERWRGRLDAEVHITVDRAEPAWRGNVGVVTKLLARSQFDPPNTTAMVCGPEIMMRFGTLDLEHAGVAPGRIYLSMERNMKCGVGLCGHCQFGPYFVCQDGPVMPYANVQRLLAVREV